MDLSGHFIKQYISELLNDGFVNCIPILDNISEIDYYLEHVKVPFQVGIRIAADEEPKFGFYTSRLGVRYNDIISLYEEKLKIIHCKLKNASFFYQFRNPGHSILLVRIDSFIQKYVDLKKNRTFIGHHGYRRRLANKNQSIFRLRLPIYGGSDRQKY